VEPNFERKLKMNIVVQQLREHSFDVLRFMTGAGLLFTIKTIVADSSSVDVMMRTGTLPFELFMFFHLILGLLIVGGVLLLLGLATRIAAAFQLPLAIGAFAIHVFGGELSASLWVLQLSPLLVLSLLSLIVGGPGSLSVDCAIGLEAAEPSNSVKDKPFEEKNEFAPTSLHDEGEDFIEQARRLAA